MSTSSRLGSNDTICLLIGRGVDSFAVDAVDPGLPQDISEDPPIFAADCDACLTPAMDQEGYMGQLNKVTSWAIFSPGQRLANERYTFWQTLGLGGTAVVWLARDTR